MKKLLAHVLAVALGIALGTGIEQVYSAVTTTSAANPLNNIVGGSINNTPIGATTPSTGAFTTLTATTVNGHTFTAGSSTFTGTAAQTYTFPTTSATLARTDSANTFTGHQTIEGVTATGATGTGNMVFATTPTLTTPVLGAATATSINFGGSTLSTYVDNTACTATVIGSGTAGTATYTTQVCQYSRIGNDVFLHIGLNYSSGTGAGNEQVSFSGPPTVNTSQITWGWPCEIITPTNLTGGVTKQIQAQIDSNGLIGVYTYASGAQAGAPYAVAARFDISCRYRV